MGGGGELGGLQTRDAAADGPPRGRVCDRLGFVSGEVCVKDQNGARQSLISSFKD